VGTVEVVVPKVMDTASWLHYVYFLVIASQVRAWSLAVTI
jgi:hypothetical protein